MDAIERLQHDHRMVEQLFRDYGSAASANQRKGVVDILVRELSKHAAVEEELFYPLADRVVPAGAAEVERHLREHLAVKRALAELDGMAPTTTAWTTWSGGCRTRSPSTPGRRRASSW